MLVNDRIHEVNQKTETLNGDIQDVEVLVIGAGMGGLAAASLLSKNGVKTYVAEKNHYVGGYFGAFMEGNTIFDYAISYALSFNEGGAAKQLLYDIGLEEKIKIIKLKKLDKYIFENQETYIMAEDFNMYIKYLKEKFPHESENIDKFFIWLKEFNDGLKKKSFGSFIIKNFLKDYEPFVRSYFTDKRLINLLSMRIQAEPSSLFIMGGFINECLLSGMYYVKGGFGGFALDIAQKICDNGSFVGTKKTVESLEYIETDKSYRATFTTGETLVAKYVVCNTSPYNLMNFFGDNDTTINKLTQKLASKVETREVGHSSICVYIKVKGIDLSAWDCGRIYIIPDELENFDVFDYYRGIESGEYTAVPILKVHIPSNHDDSLCNSEECIIRIETDMCIDYFETLSVDKSAGALQQEKEKILKYVLRKLDHNIDEGISANVTYSRVITPDEFKDIMLNDRGSGTGWAHTVNNYFKNVFSTRTVIDGCYIVGQWGELGSGLRQLILSGRKAAEDIMKKTDG